MNTDRVRALALQLPEATEEPHHEATSFRVAGKIFATIPPDEQFLNVFVQDEHLECALEAEPEIVEELRWGKRVVGVRVRMAAAGERFIGDLLQQAWQVRAPRRR